MHIVGKCRRVEDVVLTIVGSLHPSIVPSQCADIEVDFELTQHNFPSSLSYIPDSRSGIHFELPLTFTQEIFNCSKIFLV
jgi:hypothetical protein